MKLLLWVSLALLNLVPPAASTVGASCTPPGAENGYMTDTYTDAAGRSMTYYLHIPCDEPDQHSYPLVLLLHGGGERGHSGNPPEQNRSILVGDPYVKQWTSTEVQDQWPSFIVVPQLMDSQQWVDIPSAQGSYHLARQPDSTLLLAKEIVEALEQTYFDIDPGRLYITGISIGGYGVWDAIERWPDFFAAAAPLSGGGDPSKASRLTHLPIWAFQGANDGDPPVSASRAMIQAIRADGGHPLYTEFPQAGHDIWMQVYTSRAFMSWLFAQKSPPDRFGSQVTAARTPDKVRMYVVTFLLFLLGLRLICLTRSVRKPYRR